MASRPEHPEVRGGDCYKVDGDDLVEDMGISGLCLVSPANDLSVVILIALQSFFLQGVILYYIAAQLEPHPKYNHDKGLPSIIVNSAIYVHFINCVRDMPRSIFALRCFRSPESHDVETEEEKGEIIDNVFEDDQPTETFAFLIIFIVDAFVTPLAQLFIGALFLCTSATVADVIMNSCAIAYISQIDNMILQVRGALNELALKTADYPSLAIPVNKSVLKVLNLTFVVLPIYPFAFSCLMGYLGLRVFRL